MSGLEDDASLTCHGSSAPGSAAATAGPNASQSPVVSAGPAVASATAELVQKFSNTNYGPLIAAAPTIVAPSGPPAFVARPDQLDSQTGLPRIESHANLGNLRLTGTVYVLDANAHLGSLNEDGSHGENVGAGANLLNGEVTFDYRGWSLSVGVGASLGGSIASGEGRDLDVDGVPERCFKMTLGPFTLGECDEL